MASMTGARIRWSSSGGAPLALKLEVQLAILNDLGAPITVAVALGGKYGGTEPENIVNRLAGGNGIQTEQNMAARKDYEEAIARAVAGVYKRKI